MSKGMIFLADMGPVQIADLVVPIESYQQISVTKRDIARH
jgi:hypothetical protein